MVGVALSWSPWSVKEAAEQHPRFTCNKEQHKTSRRSVPPAVSGRHKSLTNPQADWTD